VDRVFGSGRRLPNDDESLHLVRFGAKGPKSGTEFSMFMMKMNNHLDSKEGDSNILKLSE
jgi:hypothetical protein